MNRRIITINNPMDDSMGASISSLVNVLQQWNTVSEGESIILDLSKITFVHPFFILPVCVLLSEQGDRVAEIQTNYRIKSYLQTILFPLGFDVVQTENWKDVLSGFSRKSYMPICKIPSAVTTAGIREELLTTFENILLNQLNLKGQIISVIICNK